MPYRAGADLSDYQRQRCRLDLYLPSTETPFPTLVWFHGGGLEGGDKGEEMHRRIGAKLASLGIGCAAANYRLSPQAMYPAYVEDAAAAVAWTMRHIEDHGGDEGQVFVGGHSAGAFLAAAVGYDPRWLKAHDIDADDLAGLLPVSPQVFTHFTIRKERGVANPQSTPVLDDAAPTQHARADAPPTLILIAENDLPTRHEECAYFVSLLKHLGHPDVAMRVAPGRDHGSVGDIVGGPDDWTLRQTLEFIERCREQRDR
ncbi:MAG: alpha/beta hydrolase [Planctomycetales bacterium]|nr:alpha/beta hydrolase [Planctomycetales bacterium]